VNGFLGMDITVDIAWIMDTSTGENLRALNKDFTKT